MATPLSRRRFLTQSAVAVGAAASAASLLDLGHLSRAEAADDASVTTITVMGLTAEIHPQYITDFERKNPAIKVRFLTFDPVRLNAMFNAGQPPDYIRIPGAPDIPHTAALGLALNLDPYFARSKVLNPSNLLPVNNSFRWDGKVQGQGPRYGMTHGWEPDVQLWYNKTLFGQAGVTPPSATQPLSYDELLRLAKKVTVRKHGKIQVYGLDPEWGWFTQAHILNLLAQEGKTLWNADYTEASFTSPEVRKILQWYVDWAQARVGPSPLDPDPQWTGALWQANRLAMTTYGYWFEGFLIQNNPAQLKSAGFAPGPLWGPKRVSADMIDTGAYIAAASKNQDAAWAFFEYYMAGKPAYDRAVSGWGFSPLKSLMPLMPHATSEEQEFLTVAQNDVRYDTTLHFSPYISDAAMETAIQKYINPVMLGQAQLDSALQQLEAAVNKQLQLGKQQVGG